MREARSAQSSFDTHCTHSASEALQNGVVGCDVQLRIFYQRNIQQNKMLPCPASRGPEQNRTEGSGLEQMPPTPQNALHAESPRHCALEEKKRVRLSNEATDPARITHNRKNGLGETLLAGIRSKIAKGRTDWAIFVAQALNTKTSGTVIMI